MKRALNMLGLCMRAGKLVTGEKASVQAVRAGSAHAVILDAGAAKNAEKAVTDACAWRKVPLIRAPEGALGAAIGKPGRMVAAITDEAFARRILELAKESD